MNKKQWLKLDNAAIIYPATKGRKFSKMFRVSATLTEKIDVDILNIALKNIMKRFPTFNYELKEGLFWCYFDYIDDTPIVTNDYNNPMLAINFKENKKYQFRVRVYNKRIALEVFHALTDGTGGIKFLLTLVGEYLHLKYNLNINYNEMVLNPLDEPTEDEINDAFLKYARRKGKAPKEKKAFHLSGTLEPDHILNIITGTIPINELKNESKKYDATITEYIVSLMIYSLQELQKEYNKREIKVCVPVNLRNYYQTNTLRNFSSYVNPGIETKGKKYSLEKIIKLVKKQMQEMTNEKKINEKISGNVNLMENKFIASIPMFIKKYVISLVEYIEGDGYVTTTFSNLNLIKVPKEMEEYIEDLNFILSKFRGTSGGVSAVGFKDNMYISFSRKIKETDFERIFFTNLVNQNINVTIESNR